MFRIKVTGVFSLLMFVSLICVMGGVSPSWGQVVLRAGHNQVPEYPHGKIILYFADREVV
jgi:hypothetical protein